jgi:DNA-binding transcriptional MerR regulator
MTGVKAHVLRYWESEFPDLHPKKNRAGNRSYREKDIRMVITIRDLLYKQGFTIQGARMQIRGRREEGNDQSLQAAATLDFPAPSPVPVDDDKARALLRTMKRELVELRKRLD